MRFYSLERSSPLLDMGHGTQDMGHRLKDIGHGSRDGFMSFEKLWGGGGGGGGGGWVHLDYNVSSGPFFEF